MLGSLLLLATLPTVHLDVQADAPCGLATRLPTALAEAGLRTEIRGDYRVQVAKRGDGILVRVLDRKGRLFLSRTLVPQEDDCPVVPRTLALLLRSALTTLPAPAEADAGEVAAAPTAEGAAQTSSLPPTVARAEPVDRSAEERHAAPDLEMRPTDTRAEAVDVGPAAILDAGIAAPIAESPVVITAKVDGGVLNPAASVARSLWILAGGGGALDMTGAPVAHGAASVEWGFREPWGAFAEVGIDSRRSIDAPPGRIGLSVYWAGLAVRRAIVTLGALTGLYAGLGVRGFLMQARATGFAVGRGDVFLGTAGFDASVDWRQAVWRGLLVFARLGGMALIRPEVLYVSGIDPVLVLPAWSAFLQVGLGLRLD